MLLNFTSLSISNASATDAILAFVNDVHSAWNHGWVTSALTFDIKGYFDFVNHDRLLSELKARRIPLEIVRFNDILRAWALAGLLHDSPLPEKGAVILS